jgi:hypothetical protein
MVVLNDCIVSMSNTIESYVIVYKDRSNNEIGVLSQVYTSKENAQLDIDWECERNQDFELIGIERIHFPPDYSAWSAAKYYCRVLGEIAEQNPRMLHIEPNALLGDWDDVWLKDSVHPHTRLLEQAAKSTFPVHVTPDYHLSLLATQSARFSNPCEYYKLSECPWYSKYNTCYDVMKNHESILWRLSRTPPGKYQVNQNGWDDSGYYRKFVLTPTNETKLPTEE